MGEPRRRQTAGAGTGAVGRDIRGTQTGNRRSGPANGECCGGAGQARLAPARTGGDSGVASGKRRPAAELMLSLAGCPSVLRAPQLIRYAGASALQVYRRLLDAPSGRKVATIVDRQPDQTSAHADGGSCAVGGTP